MSETKINYLLDILTLTDEELMDFIFWCCARGQATYEGYQLHRLKEI